MRTLAKILVIVYAGMFLLAGCVSTKVTQVGTETFSPLPKTTHVFVFANEIGMDTVYIPLGLIHNTARAYLTPYVLNDVIDTLKDKARELGANALIVEQGTDTDSFYLTLDVRARAVRLPDKLLASP